MKTKPVESISNGAVKSEVVLQRKSKVGEWIDYCYYSDVGEAVASLNRMVTEFHCYTSCRHWRVVTRIVSIYVVEEKSR